MSTTNKTGSPEDLKASLEHTISAADEAGTADKMVLGDGLPTPLPTDAAGSPLAETATSTAPVDDDDPTVEQPAIDELLAFESDEVGVLVLTRDDSFYDTVQSAVGSGYPVLYAQSRKEALEAVLADDCGVLITDAGHSPREVAKLSIQLKEHLPSLVTIVAGRRDDGDALMDLLSSGHVHRFLLKPISPGQTRLLVESSARRHLELKENPDLLVPFAPEERGSPVNISWPVMAIAAGIIVVFGVGLTLWLSGDDDLDMAGAIGESVVTTTDSAAALSGQIGTAVLEGGFPATGDPAAGVGDLPVEPQVAPAVLELLASAEAAFVQGRLTEPAGDNALDYYQALLGMDPNNAHAADGVAAIIDVLFNQAERALVEERLDDAAALIDQIRQVEPTHPRLSFMDVQWSREQQRVALASAPDVDGAVAGPGIASSQSLPPAVEAVATAKPIPEPPREAKPQRRGPTKLERLITTAAQRLEAGAWVEGDATAKASLLAARKEDSNNRQVQSLWEDLQAKVVAAGERAVADGDLDRAASWLDEARELDVPSQQLTTLDNAIRRAQQAEAEAARADLLAKGLDRLQQGRLTTPPDDSAASYLSQLRDLDANHAGLSSALLDLSGKLLGKADDAATGADWPAAMDWLDHAEALDLNEDAVAATGGRLRREMRQAELLSQVISATQLTLVTARSPRYPRQALRRDQEGWVELEFTVAGDGTTREIEVRAAEPGGVFDEAAIAALEGYVFEPYVEASEIYQRRARVRVRFALN